MEICSRVELSEINGSETFLHFHYRNRSLVMQEQGVHSRGVGEGVCVYVRPQYFYVFDQQGNLVVSPET
jgi:glycerol transport system ATP-binding protein